MLTLEEINNLNTHEPTLDEILAAVDDAPRTSNDLVTPKQLLRALGFVPMDTVRSRYRNVPAGNAEEQQMWYGAKALETIKETEAFDARFTPKAHAKEREYQAVLTAIRGVRERYHKAEARLKQLGLQIGWTDKERASNGDCLVYEDDRSYKGYRRMGSQAVDQRIKHERENQDNEARWGEADLQQYANLSHDYQPAKPVREFSYENRDRKWNERCRVTFHASPDTIAAEYAKAVAFEAENWETVEKVTFRGGVK